MKKESWNKKTLKEHLEKWFFIPRVITVSLSRMLFVFLDFRRKKPLGISLGFPFLPFFLSIIRICVLFFFAINPRLNIDDSETFNLSRINVFSPLFLLSALKELYPLDFSGQTSLGREETRETLLSERKRSVRQKYSKHRP